MMEGYPMVASRPVMPKDYGVPQSFEGLLPWTYVEERMAQALNYWVSTTRPDGRPHAMPVWGAWIEGAFYFEGSPQTRRARNLARNPAMVVHLESGSQVVIIEGQAVDVGKPEKTLAEKLSQEFSRKYAPQGYQPGPENWDRGGLLRMTPVRAFGWTKFFDDATRWEFKPGASDSD